MYGKARFSAAALQVVNLTCPPKCRKAADGALIERGSAARLVASLHPNLIGRPVALRPLARTLLVPVRPREAVLHPAVAMANPDVEVWAVGFRHGVAFRQYFGATMLLQVLPKGNARPLCAHHILRFLFAHPPVLV